MVVFAFLLQYTIAYFEIPRVVATAEQSNGLPLTINDFSGSRLEWLLKVQDPDFYHHPGFDWWTRGAGYTTMTQGLVKRLFYPSGFKRGFLRWRKLQQTIIAVAFNSRVSKDEQLRLFVNLAYMGERNGRPVVGFSQAAQEYFGKNFQALTDEEYLSLVAVLVSPERYSPTTHLAANRERVTRIHRLIAGTCKPNGLTDVEYVGCSQ
ncbi:MAG TPA: biosynthetic peptidoglycan transglycosylase [Terriglobales bacterium]